MRIDPYSPMRIAIREYDPATLCENTMNSLLFMRKREAFKPVWKAIDKKIEEAKELFTEEKKRFEKASKGGSNGIPSDINKKLKDGEAKMEERGDGICVIKFTTTIPPSTPLPH